MGTMQETTMPDPEQMKTFAREMMPFTNRQGDLKLKEIEGKYYLTQTDEEDKFKVEYLFKPTKIKVEVDIYEWKNASEIEQTDIDHKQAYERALCVDEGEDYFTARGMCPEGPEEAQYEAYWVLETTSITRFEA